MQSQAQMAAKDSKIGAIKKLQFLPAECYGLYVIRCYWHRFSEDDGSWNGEI
jgi:hypothetical protein